MAQFSDGMLVLPIRIKGLNKRNCVCKVVKFQKNAYKMYIEPFPINRNIYGIYVKSRANEQHIELSTAM